jgi:tetratricopeptide (TPR) repeat protein
MTDQPTDWTEQAIESQVADIRRELEKQNFAGVLTTGIQLLESGLMHPEVLYFVAVSLRMQQKIDAALDYLKKLEHHFPNFSRLYQERGHCYIFLRQADQAIMAFEQAIGINPALPASWSALSRLYAMVGRNQDSLLAQGHVNKLSSLPVEVISAKALLSDGEVAKAEQLIRPYLAKKPDDVEALRLLATIAREAEFTTDTEIILAKLLEIAPDYHAARYDYVLSLVDLHKHAQAKQQAELLMAQEPNNRGVFVTYAGILLALGQVDEAIERYQKLLTTTPEDAELNQSLGHAYKTAGRQEEAVNSYRAATRVRPGFGEAYWSLANLKTYEFSESEIVEMKDCAASESLKHEDQFHLCFALGKALEDKQDYVGSFHYYERGNALKRKGSRYRAEIQEKAINRQIELCTEEFFAQRADWGYPDAAPIFILGLPRAGSTLLEQILASHSQVEGTMELANIPRLVGSLGGNRRFSESHYPNVLTELSAEECLRFGENYITETQVYRTGKAYFIDKMPNNFRNIALIRLMLPNAKIIDARRNAMDCCFSNFKQLYASGHQFSYSLADIGAYYRNYVKLMDHWDNVIPSKVLRVQHEDVLNDLAGSVRRILDFCGLPFEDACVNFYQNQRRVHTASAEQVRRPINRDGVDNWRPFEQWLGPLTLALGECAR